MIFQSVLCDINHGQTLFQKLPFPCILLRHPGSFRISESCLPLRSEAAFGNPQSHFSEQSHPGRWRYRDPTSKCTVDKTGPCGKGSCLLQCLGKHLGPKHRVGPSFLSLGLHIFQQTHQHGRGKTVTGPHCVNRFNHFGIRRVLPGSGKHRSSPASPGRHHGAAALRI